jgi:hypothetical protein
MHSTGNAQVDGALTVTGGATAGSMHSTGSATVDTTLDVGGAVYIANSLYYHGYQLWAVSTTGGYQTIEFTADGWLLQHEGSTGKLTYYSPGGDAVFYTLNADFHVMGNVFAQNVSDERTKRNVEPYTRGLADLIQLRPVSYSYNGLGGTTDDGARRIGLQARQSRPFIPECVIPTPAPPPGPMQRDGSVKSAHDARLPDQLSWDDKPLLYALLNAVRELSTRLVNVETILKTKEI